MLYDKFGADDSVVDSIVDYAYNNFDVWFSQAPGDVDYFHDLRYEDEILFMEDRLDALADHIYDEGEDFVRDLGMDKDEVYNLIALKPEVGKEIAKGIVDKFYKSSKGAVSKTATEFTEEENAYMDYLDEVYPDTPNYGLLLYQGDPIAFQVGMEDWLSERE